MLARGKALDIFEDQVRPSTQLGYIFEPRANLDATADRMDEAFGSQAAEIATFVESLVGLDTKQTEIIATLYAAWNDLLADGERVTDAQLLNAFYAWHPSKRAFQANEIRIMKQWMIGDGVVPTGRAKRTLPLRKQ